MAEPGEERILNELRKVMDPDLHRDIVTLGFIKDLKISNGAVSFRIELTTPACPVKDQLKRQAYEAVSAVPGVKKVEIEMSAAVRGEMHAGPLLTGVKNVIAVASGKGGVGKSTVSCNLAIALAETGAKVGLLDSDIYGPTIPLMMGINEQPVLTEDNKIIPVERYGVGLMSLGFFLEEDKAVAWRGPMIGKFLQQVLGDVLWGDLDYLVVDLPPGTGDAPMSLAQMIPLTGVVVVMTPQDVASHIANKSIAMFRMMGEATERAIPILGVVENMSGFCCPHCGEVTYLFNSGGGEKAAQRLGVPFLGKVPLDPNVCTGGDSGKPVILSAPASAPAEAFRLISGRIASQISIINSPKEMKK